MLPEAAVGWSDVEAWELGNVLPGNFHERLRRTRDFAKKHGYAHGFPNFHHADYGQGTVYGSNIPGNQSPG